MFFIGPESDGLTDDHEGYVAGRYRDGYRSDIWTDVSRCAGGTFVSYLAACACGWTGSDRPYSDQGYRRCERDWVIGHFAPDVLSRVRGPAAGAVAVVASGVDFDFDFTSTATGDGAPAVVPPPAPMAAVWRDEALTAPAPRGAALV